MSTSLSGYSTRLVEGKVIRILDEYSILIDLGVRDGIEIDDEVKIVEIGDPIEDLDGNSLGTYDFCKAKLTITEVQFSFCKAQNIMRRNTSSFMDTISQITKSLGGIGVGGETIDEPQELNIDQEQMSPLNKTELDSKTITLGDVAQFISTRS